MRFRFAGYWLNGDPSASTWLDDPPAKIISKSAVREQQITGGPEWEFREGIDRENQWTTVSFQCIRRFSSTQDAEAYVLGYEAAGHHEWKGSLYVFLDAATVKVCEMHGALIQPPSLKYDHCVVTATYTIQGPQFTAAATATYMLFASYGGNLFPSGEASPAAGQAFAISGANLVPTASISTADSFWEDDGSGNYRPKA